VARASLSLSPTLVTWGFTQAMLCCCAVVCYKSYRGSNNKDWKLSFKQEKTLLKKSQKKKLGDEKDVFLKPSLKKSFASNDIKENTVNIFTP
jgi:hypothetical protein